MSSKRQERDEFIAVLTRELPERRPLEVVDLARRLMRAGATYSRLAVALCNGRIDQEPYEQRTDKIETRITALLKGTGIKARFGGDPRGATVKLLLPSGVYNSWGGPEYGYCVPGS